MLALRSVVLALAGAAGAVTLLWVALSAALGWGLVVVVTGSMEPVIPAGSASVTVPVSASDLRIGDVVTVSRGRGVPSVTHRVVAIDDVTSDRASRSLTLRGDANTTDDPEPVVVRETELVVATFPGMGHALVTLRSPIAIGAGTILIAVLVVWSFWPEGSRDSQPRAAPASAGGGAPRERGRHRA